MPLMDLRSIDLNLLLALDALLAEQSVSRAARRLGLGQPAASAALARLRKLLGDPLLIRVGSGMVRSELAERLAPMLAEALSRLSAVLDNAAAFEPATATRGFVMAGTDYTSPLILPGLLARMRREAPGVSLRVRGYGKSELPGLLATRAVDLAIGVFRPPPETLVATSLFEETLVGLASQATAGRLPMPLTPEGFAALPFALFTVNGDAIGVGDNALAPMGLRRRVMLALPHLAALPAVLAASDMVAVVPSRFARTVCSETLTMFELPVAFPRFDVQLLWSPATRSDGGLAWLRRLVTETAHGL